MRIPTISISRRRNSSGTNSFCVDAGKFAGKSRYRKFFKTRREAVKCKKRLLSEAKNHGSLATKLTTGQQADAVSAFARLAETGDKTSLADVVSFYLRKRYPGGGRKKVSELVEEFLAEKARLNKGSRYIKELKCKYRRFTSAFGTQLVAEVTTEAIQKWIDEQKHGKVIKCGPGESGINPVTEKERPFTALTRNNYRTDLAMLFSFGKSKKFCDENPVIPIGRASIQTTPVKAYSITETAIILASARRTEKQLGLTAPIALGLFAGLRDCELMKMDWEDVSLHKRTIEIRADVAKGMRYRTVSIPENLAAWLENIVKVAGPVVPFNWERRRRKLLVEYAEVTPIKNGLRHTFGTFHLANSQSAEATALQMGNSPGVLHAHYKKPVSHEEGIAYFKIRPSKGWKLEIPEVLRVSEESDIKILPARTGEGSRNQEAA